MIVSFFEKLLDLFERKKSAVIFIFIIVSVLSVFAVLQGSFHNDITTLLPQEQNIKKTLKFLNNSGMSDTVVFSISLRKEQNQEKLLSLTSEFAKDLESIKYLSSVNKGVDGLDYKRISEIVKKNLPVLLTPEEQNKIFKTINSEEKIEQKFRDIFIMLNTPGTSIVQSNFALDPFNWSNIVFKEIGKLTKGFGFQVQVKDGRFINESGKYALILAKTNASLTKGFESKSLMNAVNKVVKQYPNLNVDTISGHRHTVSNEKIIRKDVALTLTIVGICFLILMLLVFRSVEMISVFLLPFWSILVSAAIMTIFLPEVSFFIMGFASVIAGISVDYGIHIFTAYKSQGKLAVKKIIKPVIVASTTTIGVFLSFFFSTVEGYKELAAFSIISIVLCVIMSLAILPNFWSKNKKPINFNFTFYNFFSPKTVIIIWGIFIVLSFYYSTKTNVNTDVESFDGTSEEILKTEERFHDIWGGKGKYAAVVYETKNVQKGWEKYDNITGHLENKLTNFISFASIVGSKKQRKINVEHWKSYWTDSRINNLKEEIGSQSQKYNFKAGVFEDFFKKTIKADQLNGDIEKLTAELGQLKDLFIKNISGNYRFSAYFTDSEVNVGKAKELIKNINGAYVVSPTRLSESISKQVNHEMKKVSIIAFAWVFLISFLFLKRLSLTVLALIPVFTSVLATLSVFNYLGIPVTAVVLIAMVVILGLSIDYGVFVVYSGKTNRQEIIKAATFSYITSISGAGALLFAEHPVMFSIGLTLVSGVTAAYLSAIFCIPAFEKVHNK